MCNKRSVVDDKMTDAYITEARNWGEDLLRKEYRGLGDTIEAAAGRAERKWGAPASILLRLRNRHGLTDMKLSSFVAVAEAHFRAFSKKTDELYDNERSRHASNSKAVWLADLVSGATSEGASSQVLASSDVATETREAARTSRGR